MFENLSSHVKKELRDTGVVYLLDMYREADDQESPRFVGYWEAELDGEDTIIEAAPGFDDLASALRWARKRASVVVLSDSDGHTTIYD